MGADPMSDYSIALRDADGGNDPEKPMDDIVVNGVSMFHMEDMGDWWWIGLYLNGKTERLTLNLTIEEDEIVVRSFELPKDVKYEGVDE